MTYNEEDTKLHCITPVLQSQGWVGPRITMEYPISAGQIVLQGDSHQRLQPQKADYLLRYSESLPIAVVEAKDEEHAVGAGLQQAMGYAEKLGLLFAYSSNGHGFEEWDFTNNTQRSIGMTEFPTPEELWQRLCVYRALDANRPVNPLLHPYWRDPTGKKMMRYYQEVAVNRAIEAIVKGKNRILLNLATGTGKTFISFQIAWKLIKSGYFANKRILFLADRVVLRGQAFNAFEPFKDGSGDPRAEISGEVPLGRQIYFGIYQGMYGTGSDGLRLFEQLPADYFDLIIIDECHRSGFGTWNEILRHFPGAIQLGMTATPKRSDNVDTFQYFGEPIFTYSLGQGIDDGFLANYKIHKAKTDLDVQGLTWDHIVREGARVDIPPDATPREHYATSDFERQITLPDRVKVHCEHLSSLLRVYGRMEKTIIFCVNQDHALEVRDHLNRLSSDLNIANYAVRIVSEESDAQALLEKFQAVEKPTPVIASTVDLLSTGVDAPSVRNIVFFKTINSPTVFKQIIGRGSRLCEDTDKYWFRIIDYTGATDLFDEWDKPTPPATGGAQTTGPRVCWLGGKVLSEKTGQPIADAVITVQLGPNEIVQQRSGSDGQFLFSDLPAGEVIVTASAYGHKKTASTLSIEQGAPRILTVQLKPSQPPRDKMIRVSGLEVRIVDEKYEERDAQGNLVSPQDYLKKVRREIIQVCSSLMELRSLWIDPERRRELLQRLEDRQVAVEVLAEILKRSDVDSFDLLAHIAFDETMHSREERAVALFNLNQQFFAMYPERARVVLQALVERYVQGGLDEILDPEVFKLPPIRREVGQVAPLFGGMRQFVQARNTMIQYLYP
ncbi:MAG TPA: DEAD/DEAH box helicase family protein [Bellilinea sp.]|nr:DEAD/DEAH box helicase family protein [Bellilinea sp.]